MDRLLGFLPVAQQAGGLASASNVTSTSPPGLGVHAHKKHSAAPSGLAGRDERHTCPGAPHQKGREIRGGRGGKRAWKALHRPALRDALIDARGSELRALQEAASKTENREKTRKLKRIVVDVDEDQRFSEGDEWPG